MTIPEKKEYLSRYLNLDREITLLFEELARYKDLSIKMTPVFTASRPGGMAEDRLQVSVDRIAVVEDRINRKIDEWTAVRDSIVSLIDTVEDPRLRTLLLSKYIRGKTYEQIALEMHYSWRHVMRLHNQALSGLSPEPCGGACLCAGTPAAPDGGIPRGA